MSAVRVDDPPAWYAPPPAAPPLSLSVKPSGWFRRVNATLVDGVVLFAGTLVVLSPVLVLAATGVVPPAVAVIGFYVGYLAAILANQVLQGRTGATVGKLLLGLRVVDERTFEHISVRSSVARYFVHFIDTLPCYLGLLAPIVDRKRRTFTDMAMGTLVIRAPRARVGVGAGLIATTLTGVLATASFALVAMAAPLADWFDEPAGATGQQTAAAAGPLMLEPLAPPTPPPGGALPAGDLAGRVMRPLPGFESAPGSMTGDLTVEQIAGEGDATPQETATVAENLRSWGMLRGHGQVFERPELAYTVMVYEFGSAEEAAAYVREAFTEQELVDVSLAEAVALVPEAGTAQRGLFAHGPHVWEVALFTDGRPVELGQLRSVLLAQQTHARVVG